MLRRTIVLCMAVCLIMTGCLHAAAAAEGSADQLSSRLDAAFASGRATLRDIPLAGLTIRPEDVVVPPGFESEAQGEQLRQWIDTLYVVSLSPDGTTAMLTDGDQLLAWRQGKLRVILQSAARGVEDVNGNLTSLWKSPYKRYFSGVLGKGGRHTIISSYYVHFEPDNLMLGGGVWWPEKTILEQLRLLIDAEPEEFLKIVRNREFTRRYSWECATLKKIPAGFDPQSPVADFLKMKEYIVMMRPDESYFDCEDWVERVAADLKPMKPLHDFLNYVFD